ncbi:unnamed protein product, partial [Discosporangium mesarthrocarpum]
MLTTFSKVIRTLGHGSYGEVAEARDLETKTTVAIKRVLNIFDSEVDTKRIYREMYILRHMRHPEIIHLRDVIAPKSYEHFADLYLVFEYVDTDLYKLIGSQQFLTNDHIKYFLYQMLTGLKYIHSAYVIHRDVKPANILLNEDCTLKICDFGLSRVVSAEHIARDPSRARKRRKIEAGSPNEARFRNTCEGEGEGGGSGSGAAGAAGAGGSGGQGSCGGGGGGGDDGGQVSGLSEGPNSKPRTDGCCRRDCTFSSKDHAPYSGPSGVLEG